MQKVNLYHPLFDEKNELPPLTLRVGVKAPSIMVEGGTPEVRIKSEVYVLLSALPRDLQARVSTAVQALIDGM